MHPPSTLPSARLFARVIAAAVALVLVAAGVVAAGATRALAAVTLPATLLDTASTTWRYSDDNSDPARGDADRLVWAKAGYDDSAWKSAKGAFGAKNGKATGIGANFPIGTLLNQYIDGVAAPDVKTYHFRSSFDLSAEQLGAVSGLGATITYDDAIQVFVNGSKVAGFVDSAVEAAPEAQRNLMYAGANGGDPVTSTFTIPASALSAGTNTVAIALYQDRATSSDIYLDVKELIPIEADVPATLDDIVLTIGSDETRRNVTWYTNRDTAQGVQVVKKSELVGTDFPASAKTITASGAATTSGEFNRRAEIAGLAENTEYVYRVGSDADGWSAAYGFRTAAFSGDYDFLFVGDPQIGASGNVANDQAGWADTLDVAQQTYPSAELLFSAGDQVESAGNENHYAAFLAPDQLRELPLVPVNGNHDVGSKAYEQHYTVPNLDSTAGAATSGTSSGGDYWFEYKDVLFMVINSNSRDYSTHVPFLEKVVAEHGADAKWKVLAFHHSIYSVASHVNDSSIQDLRANLPGTISKLGIDLVLQGHDHSYTRSYLVKDGALADSTELPGQSSVSAKPGEVLYVTANSASGSKYYNVIAPNAWYASVINQEKVRNYSHVSVTGGAITITTLRSQQNGTEKPVNSVVDEVTLTREDTVAPTLTVPADSSIKAGSSFDPMEGVTAVDDVDGDLTSAVTVTGSVDTATLGDYVLGYAVTDAAGNTATASRTVSVVEGSFSVGAAPAISGTAAVGSPLAATAGTYTPTPTSVAYQWLRNGVAIEGATDATFTPAASDAGAAFSVRVTVKRAGFADEVTTTAAVTVPGATTGGPGTDPAQPAVPATPGTPATDAASAAALAATGATAPYFLIVLAALLVAGGATIAYGRRVAAQR